MTDAVSAGLGKDAALEPLRALPLTIDGVRLDAGQLDVFAESHARQEGHVGDLARFIREWRSASASVTVFTSGSTGEPRAMEALKTRMAASARATCQALRLESGQTALLAMPLRYIAARMVVVRALVAGLNLLPVPPSSSPLKNVEQRVDFAALTPMQAWTSLQDEATAERLRQVRCLLLGGGAISAQLAVSLTSFPHEVWSSYGMTETLSHIALRRINGPDASLWYTPLPGVTARLTAEGTLAILAPRVADGELVTSDLAQLDGKGRFRILCRRDNVVNTGGVKVSLEAAEELLEPVLKAEFCLTSLPDTRLGEKIVLLYTGAEQAARLEQICRHVLPRYWVPRLYLAAQRIPRTGTGKIARQDARELAGELAASL